jgi:hypothetical protein
MNTTYELNNLRKDADVFTGKFHKGSPIVEVFSAMVNGESLDKFGAKADKAVAYIKDLGNRAENGDYVAISELNTLRRFVIETPMLEEIKLLNIFGSYKNVGYDETIEREVYNYGGENSRIQAAGGDVVFPAITKEVYPVPTFTVSGGYAVDYRRVALGDMSKENEGMARVKTDIRNRALAAIVKKVYDAIDNATGVKYGVESANLQKASVDALINNVRRFGKPTVIGDYSLISQFNDWAGYQATLNSKDILGISEKAMNEIAANGALSAYHGAILAEMPNPYNLAELNAAGDNFKTMLPAGLGFVIPAGMDSPIATWTRGGLTSCTGTNVKTGKIETRFDLEVGCDVAKGQEYKIGVMYDTAVGGLE